MPVARKFWLWERGVCHNIVGPPSGGGGGLTEKEVEEIIARPEKIGTVQLEKLAVTAAKLAAEAVTEPKVAALAISAAKLAEEAVTEKKLGNEAVAEAKLKALAVTTAKIAAEAITEPKIANLAVTTAKLANEAVSTGKIENLAVTTAKIAAEAVTEAKLAALSVATSKLVGKSVTLAKLAEGATGMLIATQVAGVDSTGATDSTVGLQTFIEECKTKKLGGYVPRGEYKIGEAKNPLDFTKLPEDEGKRIKGYELYCDAGALFIGNAALAKEPVVKLSAKAECQFVESRFKFGKIKSGFKESDCIFVQAFNDSYLEIVSLEGASEAERANMHGVLFEVGVASPRLVANNEIHINIITTCGFGVVTVGNASGSGIQFSGNQLFVGECINNLHNGHLVDGNGVGHNTEYNNFFIGVCEHNGSAGIVDNNGNNSWNVGNTNSNGEAGFIIGPEAVAKNSVKAPCYIRGRFNDGVTLNKNPCDLVNSVNGEAGWVELETVSAKIEKGVGGGGEPGKKWACALVGGNVILSGVGKVKEAIAAKEKIAQLPVGFRPKKSRRMVMWDSAGWVFIEIEPNGEIKAASGPAEGQIIGLDGLSFPLNVLTE